MSTADGRRRVFISYSHRDGGELAQRLHGDLPERGFDTWLDTARLRGGAVWSRDIEQTLDTCSNVLALLSHGSYESDICRAEQLRALRKGKCVIPLRAQSDAEIPLQLESRHFLDFCDSAAYAERLDELVTHIEGRHGAPLPEKYRQTYVTAPPLPVNYIERDEELDELRNAVIADNSRQHIALTALRGMGGLGKTVMAQALCHDEVVQAAFPDGVIWVTIGENPGDLVVPMREIAKALGDSLDRYDTLPACSNQLRTTLRDRAVLLVLDDVWDARHVEPFRVDARRSRLLITTRDARIAASLGAQEHSLDVLTRGQALALLARWSARPDGFGFPLEAVELVYECGRLPLALAMVGAMMRGKPDDRWSRLLQTLRAADLEKIAQQFPNYAHPNLLRTIQVSVEQLDDNTRDRYLDLAVFPDDTPLPLDALAVHWSVPRDEAQEVTDRLFELSLGGRDVEGRLTIHDVQLMYTRKLREEALPSLHDRLLKRYQMRCPEGWPSGPLDGYFHDHLAYHLRRAERREELRRLLFDYEWMRAKLSACGPYTLVSDYGHLPEDDEARMIQGAIRLSLEALSADVRQLPSQLVGRLLASESRDIQQTLNQTCEVTREPWLRPRTASLEAPGGPLLMILEGHTKEVNAVAVSADGRRAVSGAGDNTLRVWDTETGALLHTLEAHTESVWAVAVSADGRRAVSGARDSTVRVWDSETGALLHTLEGHTKEVNAVAVSADGRRAVSRADDCTVRVWDTETGALVHTLEGHTERVCAVAVSADGRRAISGARDATVRVWDSETGALLHTLEAHTYSVWAVAVSADGRRAVSGGWRKTVRVWDTEKGALLHTLEGHTKEVNAVAVSADGRRAVSGADDCTVRVWDTETGALLHTFEDHTEGVNAIAVSADGRRVVSGADDCTVRVWDTETDTLKHALNGHTEWVRAVTVSADGRRVVSGADDCTVRVWESATGTLLHTFEGHTEGVNAIAVSADGRRAVSGARESTVRVWDAETGVLLHTLESHTGGVNAIAVSADGRRAVSGSGFFDETVRVWDTETGALMHTLKGHTEGILVVAISTDGRRTVSGAGDNTVRVWDTESGALLHTLEAHTNSVWAVAVSADGRRVVSGADDCTVRVWDTETGALLHTLEGHTREIRAVVVSVDGRRAISGAGDNTVLVWDTETGALLHTLEGHTERVRAVAVSADGRRAISGAGDATVRVWDLETGKCLAEFRAAGTIDCCATSPDGMTIVAGGRSSKVDILHLENVSTKPRI